jgi:DNA-directed RNA polymerase
MDQQTPLEFLKADEKRAKADTKAIKNFGYGATTGSMAITRKYSTRLAKALTDEITRYLETAHKGEYTYNFVYAIQKLDPYTIALCCLDGCLNSIGKQAPYIATVQNIGKLVAAELGAAKLTQENPKAANAIEAAVRKRHGSVQHRRQAARSAASRVGFKFKRWSSREHSYAGSWLLAVTLQTLPDVFEVYRDHNNEAWVSITEGALDLAQDALRETMLLYPVMQPVKDPILPWTDWRIPLREGVLDPFNVTFLRTNTRHRSCAAQGKAALRAGQMKPALDAVNALQGTAWTVNTRVLSVLRECLNRKIAVTGLPPDDVERPRITQPWDTMDDAQRRLHRFRVSEVMTLNRSYINDRVLLTEDLITADRCVEYGRFYTPMNCDWRGRVYGLCHFNFQREDRVRALFNFADGEPIGEDGLWWLKVHVANCGDFEKVSKQPMEARVAWTDKNAFLIDAIAADPMAKTSLAVWTNADKPFLFLAACLELSAAAAAGPEFVTHLPISFDGSCSGLQHLCAMTRAKEGSLVNLTPGDKPQDVYQRVADIVRETVKTDDTPLAQAWANFGVDRKVVKRNVMTYSYSSRAFGMAAQQEEDLIIPLNIKVMSGELEEHPFSYWAEKPHKDVPSPAAQFIAKHTYAGIETIIEKPAQAMAFLQTIAKTLAHEGKPVRWTTPVGIPWINSYHVPVNNRVSLWLYDKGVKVPYTATIAEGNSSQIDKKKSANGIAPNFVHALDAAHLMLTANAAAAEGIVQATVHDSFGCLASRATRYNQIIRAEFVRMYETHDPLAEVLEQAKCDLTQHNWERLPEVPSKGPLNIKDVEHARYAFA